MVLDTILLRINKYLNLKMKALQFQNRVIKTFYL